MRSHLPAGLAFCAALSLAACANHSQPPEASGDAHSDAPGGEHTGHGGVVSPRGEVSSGLNYPLDPARGGEIGEVYESWLSPQQEGEEESEVPAMAPEVFLSTKGPSLDREDRPSRGHGILAFNREYSRAYVELAISDINPEDIVMAHIHCGKPGMLGPILVDFGKTGEISDYFSDGVLSYEITNRDLEMVIDDGSGLVGAFAHGCPIILARPGDRVRTIAGMATIAAEGELYFNIHTAQQTFYGDIRGQLKRIEWPPDDDDEAPAAEEAEEPADEE